VSITLGRPVAVRDEDIDLSLPSHLSDEEFGLDRPIPPPSSSESETPGLSPFLHLIKIRHLSGKVFSTMYAAKQRDDIAIAEKVQVRQQLFQEIMNWRAATASLKLEQRAPDGQTFVSCFLSPEWYEAVANNALLLLYRPSPYLPYPVRPTKASGEWGDLHHMFNAAKSSINSYYERHRTRRLNYSWITLHGVFVIALAYVYAVGRALKDPTQAMPIPDYLDIINDTRSCSNVLVAICERWNVARSSCELFNRLSIDVIKDAIVAATKKDNALATQVRNVSSSTEQDGQVERMTTPLSAQNHPQRSRQPGNGDSNLQTSAAGTTNQFDHMFVADEFRQYPSDLDSFLLDENLRSELAMGLSQEWPFDGLQFLSHGGFDMPLPELGGTW